VRPVVESFGGLALIRGGGCGGAADADLELPRRLLGLGADPDTLEGSASPLRTAIEARHVGFVRRLLDAGARPDRADADGVTPLMILMGYATSRDDRRRPARALDRAVDAIATALIDAGADVNARTTRPPGDEPAGRTALMYGLGMLPRNVTRLLESGADPTLGDAEGGTALHVCREPATAARLRARGADVSARAAGGRTPLCSAIEAGCLPMVQWLWRFPETRTVRTTDGRTPLDLARSHGREDLVEWLAARTPPAVATPVPERRPAPAPPAPVSVPGGAEMLVVHVVTEVPGLSGAERFAPLLSSVAALSLPAPTSVTPPGRKAQRIRSWEDPAVLLALDAGAGVTDVRDADGRARLLLGQSPEHGTLRLEIGGGVAAALDAATLRTFLEAAVVALRAVYAQCHLDVRSRVLHRTHYAGAPRTFYASGLFWLTFFGDDELERQGGDAVVLNPFAACAQVGHGVLLQVGQSPQVAVTAEGEQALVRATRALPPARPRPPRTPTSLPPAPLPPVRVAGVRGVRDRTDGSLWVAKHVAAGSRLPASMIARLARVVGASELPVARVHVLFSRRESAERNRAPLRAAGIAAWYVDPTTGTRREAPAE